MSDWTIFGERLSRIMREYDVSLRELSRRTGVTVTTLCRYANCKRVPKATEIIKCSDALGITCDYLLGLSDDPHLTGKGERIIGKGGKKKAEVKEKDDWILCSKRLPENTGPVNITWANREPEPYYTSIKDVPFTATGHYCKGKWYWFSATCQDYLDEYGECEVDAVDNMIEVIAWKPLPEPYRGGDPE